MKLSVSNIAWDNKELEKYLALLKQLECDGVEIAPSCIWEEPEKARFQTVQSLKKLIHAYGLEIPAFHALLYTKPNLCFFGDSANRKETISYLKMLIKLAGDMSVPALIFGSPRSRNIANKPYDECYGLAVEIFRELAEYANQHNTCVCIEPLSKKETDFITSADEGYQLVCDVNHTNFGLHLDAKAMFESGEQFDTVCSKYGSILKHFHVGDPGLAPPGSTGIDHSIIGKPLSSSSYKNFVSIEMRRSVVDPEQIITNAVVYVREKYYIPTASSALRNYES